MWKDTYVNAAGSTTTRKVANHVGSDGLQRLSITPAKDNMVAAGQSIQRM